MNVEMTYQRMHSSLRGLLPDFEIQAKAELASEIEQLKQDKNAVILGHNYMEPALFHSVCDFRGDSLELARQAANSTADIIVFCGVEFMAETAKILNPGRKVLIPSRRAGCSLASSITAADVRQLREQFPGVPVVTYINTYADVKAESDICCTSGNAGDVVASLDSSQVIFIPDEYLAQNIAAETGKELFVPVRDPGQAAPRPGVTPVMIGWPGRCEVHEQFTVEDVADIRRQFPETTILAHPECSAAVCNASDFSGSTSAMIRYVQSTNKKRFALLTECSMADNIVAESPDKDLVRMCSIRCPHMAQITLEMTVEALRHERYEVALEESTRLRAHEALQKMLDVPKRPTVH